MDAVCCRQIQQLAGAKKYNGFIPHKHYIATVIHKMGIVLTVKTAFWDNAVGGANPSPQRTTQPQVNSLGLSRCTKVLHFFGIATLLYNKYIKVIYLSSVKKNMDLAKRMLNLNRSNSTILKVFSSVVKKKLTTHKKTPHKSKGQRWAFTPPFTRYKSPKDRELFL